MKELTFILTTSAGTVTLDNSPDGWDESLISWARSDKYWGVFRSFTIPLKFVKTGAIMLRTEFYTYGTSGTSSIVINRLNKLTMLYEVAYSGICDFGTFRDMDNYVEINLVDSGIAKDIKDNGGTEYAFPVNDPYVGSGGGKDHAFTDGYLNQGSQYYQCWDLISLAKALLNKVTGGKVFDGTYQVKSDILDYYSIVAEETVGASHADFQIAFTPGAALRHVTGSMPIGYHPPIKTTWEDFFNAINVVFGLGVGVFWEDGKQTIRIEPKTYFFDTVTDAIPLGSSKSLTASVDSKLSINRLKIGFPAKEYTGYTLQTEPNATAFWKTPNNTSSVEYDLTCKFRGDAVGVKQAISEGPDGSDSADEDLFFIELFHWPATSEYGDYMTMKTGSTARQTTFPATSWEVQNVFLTPRRCLLRNKTFIDSLIWNFIGQDLVFTSGDNDLYNIEIAPYGYLSPVYVAEREPVEISAPQFFIPLIFEVECALPNGLIDMLNDNSTRRASFIYNGTTYYGWIMEAKAKLSGRGSGKIKLLSLPGNDFTNLVR